MRIVSILDKFSKKIIFLQAPEDTDLDKGSYAIFEDNDKKMNIGEILYVDESGKNEGNLSDEFSYLRKATLHDMQKMELQDKQAKDIAEKCKQKIKEHNLEMFLAFTEYSFDGSKINFIFTADDRVDFRELVKDLAKTFQKQIHLQQIGPRDKARLVEGRGKCGQRLCCSGWLKDLESITMDMVRSQNLESKGSSKLSGCCGKLLCCLKYEVDEYKRLKSLLPQVGNIVKVKKKDAEVIGLDILNQKVKVLYRDNSFEVVPVEDIKKIVSSQSAPAAKSVKVEELTDTHLYNE